MKTIAIIDDDKDMRELLKDILGKKGFDVQLFSNAKEAFDKLPQQQEPAAIICDVIMPDMDGREFLKSWRKLGHKTPIIMITAFGSAISQNEAMRAGAFRLLMKPFSISELVETLNLVA